MSPTLVPPSRTTAPSKSKTTRRPPAPRHRRPLFEILESRRVLALAFTPGNLLIYRVGDGINYSSNVAAPVFLDEYDPQGLTLLQSIPVPTADAGANQTLTASYIGTSEGLINRSLDGQYVLITGYDAPVGTTGLTNTLSTATARVVGRVDAAGNIDTTTVIRDGFSGGSIRSAISFDGAGLWVSGGTNSNTSGGVRYTTFGTSGPTTQISSTITNTRGLGIFAGQLFVSAMTTTPAVRLGTVGVGVPSTAGQAIANLPDIPPLVPPPFGNDPNQFFLADLAPTVPGLDTAYVADDILGLVKFALVGGTWTFNGSVPYAGGGIRGLTGIQSGGQVTLYVTTSTTFGNNELLSHVDATGYLGGLANAWIPLGYSAGPNNFARGLAFVPEAGAPVADSDPVIAGTGGDDEFLLRRVGDHLVLTAGGATLLDEPADLLNSLTVSGGDGNDRLTIDYSGGDPLPVGGVFFHGDSQSGSPGDRLTIVGTGTETATYRPDGAVNAALDNDGTVEVDGRTISFTGLEPLDMIGLAAANVIFLNANDTIVLANGLTSGGDAAIVVSGTSGGVPFESVALRNNTLVNIDTTTVDGIDTVTINSANNVHGNTHLNLTTGVGGGDMIDVNGPVVFPGDVGLASQQIDFDIGGLVTATNVVLNAGTGPITDGDGVSDVVATNLTATATTGISLDTSIANLTANNLGAGAIDIAEANALVLDNVSSANGSITVVTLAAGNMTVENVNSGAANVTLTLADGDLVSGPADPGVADIVGTTVTLDITAGTNNLGVSAANRLELNAVTLHAGVNSAGTNNAFIVDTAGGLTMNNSSINANVGNTYDLLVLGGSLLSSTSPASTRDVGATIILLQVTGAGSTIGTAATPFEINSPSATAGARVDASTPGGAADHIFISDLADNFPVGLINAGSGNAALRSTTGAITDANGTTNNVTATSLALRALTGIGSGNALETAVSNLAAENTTSGNIQIDNGVGGLLTLLNLPPVAAGFAVRNLGPGVTITNASPLVVAANVIAAGAITLTATDSAAAGDDLTVSAGITVQSTGSSVTLNAGDNATLGAAALLSAVTTLAINIDSGNLDAGVGATLTLPASADIDAVSATFTSGPDNDTFNIAPDGDGPGGDVDTPIAVNGNLPLVAPGDVLNLDVTGLGVPTLLLGPGANNGVYSFAAAASVTYNSIETVNSGGGAVNLVLDMQFEGFQDPGADTDIIFVRLDAAGMNLLIDVDGAPVFQGAAAGINSLTIIGSDDDEVLRIDETAGGLPRFAGQTPAVNNTLLGGGTANPSHLNASADLVLETLFGGLGPWDASDVTIHFDGRTGTDSIALNLLAQHDTAYTSDGDDLANSGNLGTAGAGGPDFLMSFAGLAPLNLSGVGGSLLVDATSTPATANLTLSDDAVPVDGWSQVAGDGGFETTRFRGYSQLFVVGGDGSELIDMLGLDAATTLTSAQLRGGNTADFLNLGVGNDASNETLRVRSTPAQTSVVAGGDGGDDLLQLFDGANTVDHLLANVTVSGGPIAGPLVGNDTLTVLDSGDVSGDTVVVTQNTIDGNTGFAGAPDVNYSAIDVLNVTATAAADTLDADFVPGSDLDTVNLSGWTGGDQFFLSTTDEQIGGTATGIQTINLFGDAPGNPHDPDGNDIFGQSLAGVLPGTPQGPGVRLIRPSISTLINIDGGKPTAIPNPPVGDQVGDELNLDVSALAPPVLVATLGGNPSLPGVAQSIAAPPSHRPVNFVEIEDINLVDGGILTDVEMGDLYIRGSNNADSVSFLATANPNVARVQVNAFQGYFAITRRVIVYARGGNDYLQLGNFNHPAEFYGGAGDDYLAGYLASDKLVGGQGRDRINASQGNNVVWGDSDPVEVGLPDTEANRQLMASISSGQRLESLDADILSTLDGNDTMYGGPGADSMTLGGGADYAYGGRGDDSIALGAGDDRGYGGLGNDTITGSGGNDLINGGEGNDSVSGDQGLDVLIGGGGNDAVNGGDGNDLLFDGRINLGGVSADSQTIGDASDAAMLALLLEWSASNPAVGPLALAAAASNDHDGTDQVRGHAGADSFSADAADILDFELGLDAILP